MLSAKQEQLAKVKEEIESLRTKADELEAAYRTVQSEAQEAHESMMATRRELKAFTEITTPKTATTPKTPGAQSAIERARAASMAALEALREAEREASQAYGNCEYRSREASDALTHQQEQLKAQSLAATKLETEIAILKGDVSAIADRAELREAVNKHDRDLLVLTLQHAPADAKLALVQQLLNLGASAQVRGTQEVDSEILTCIGDDGRLLSLFKANAEQRFNAELDKAYRELNSKIGEHSVGGFERLLGTAIGKAAIKKHLSELLASIVFIYDRTVVLREEASEQDHQIASHYDMVVALHRAKLLTDSAIQRVQADSRYHSKTTNDFRKLLDGCLQNIHFNQLYSEAVASGDHSYARELDAHFLRPTIWKYREQFPASPSARSAAEHAARIAAIRSRVASVTGADALGNRSAVCGGAGVSRVDAVSNAGEGAGSSELSVRTTSPKDVATSASP
jgi:hypothetical protein